MGRGCLAFFGFLRVGELTSPDDASYDLSVHLSFADIAVDDPFRPSFVRVAIKQSETDPFRRGVDLFLGRTGNDLCPVGAIFSGQGSAVRFCGPAIAYP
jgi:hypothetical protein